MSKAAAFWTLASCLALAASDSVVAQDAAPEADTEASAGVQEGGEVEVPVEREAALSAQEQVEQANSILNRGQRLSRRAQSMLDEARRDKDIIRVTCLNDKLTQINANLRTVERRVEALKEASELNDEDRRNHEYTVLTVLSQKFDTLDQEANQCIGQDIYETGATEVTTEIDPGTPSEDPTVAPEPVAAVPAIPPPASGTF